MASTKVRSLKQLLLDEGLVGVSNSTSKTQWNPTKGLWYQYNIYDTIPRYALETLIPLSSLALDFFSKIRIDVVLFCFSAYFRLSLALWVMAPVGVKIRRRKNKKEGGGMRAPRA